MNECRGKNLKRQRQAMPRAKVWEKNAWEKYPSCLAEHRLGHNHHSFTHTASVAELSNLSCRHGRKLVFSLRCAYSADDLLCAWLACRSCFCFSYHAPTWERRASSSPDAKLYYAVNLTMRGLISTGSPRATLASRAMRFRRRGAYGLISDARTTTPADMRKQNRPSKRPLANSRKTTLPSSIWA